MKKKKLSEKTEKTETSMTMSATEKKISAYFVHKY